MPLDARIADALRAADAATSWRDVSNSLHALDPDGEDLTVRPFYFAFSYTLLERTSPRRDRVGGPFGSWSAGEGWRFPPEVSTIEDVDVQAWMDAFEEIDSPAGLREGEGSRSVSSATACPPRASAPPHLRQLAL